MGKTPIRLKEVVYTLSSFEQSVMSGLWKDLPHKMAHYLDTVSKQPPGSCADVVPSSCRCCQGSSQDGVQRVAACLLGADTAPLGSLPSRCAGQERGDLLRRAAVRHWLVLR